MFQKMVMWRSIERYGQLREQLVLSRGSSASWSATLMVMETNRKSWVERAQSTVTAKRRRPCWASRLWRRRLSYQRAHKTSRCLRDKTEPRTSWHRPNYRSQASEVPKRAPQPKIPPRDPSRTSNCTVDWTLSRRQ